MNQVVKGVLLVSSLVLVAAFTQGCATSIKASSSQNPPPAEAFNGFGRIQVKEAVFKAGAQGNLAALTKINQNFQKNLAPSLIDWNKGQDNGRTLVIEPVVDELSFKGGAKRILLGALVGSSGVLMRLNIHDSNGREIAAPQFFQQTAAMSGAYTFGVQDNLMLTRVASLASTYVKTNYSHNVGGPTGGADPVIPAP